VHVVSSPSREAVRAALGDRRSVVTIGAFDGVHRGHLAVIGEVIRRARLSDSASVIVTFERHPASVVRPESAPLLLTDTEQNLAQLDATIVVPFGEREAQESATSFAERVFVDALHVRDIVVGEDFHFGHRRSGNVAFLRTMGADHDFVVEPLVLVTHAVDGNAPTSSTAIRAALKLGDVRTAALMLGRDHELRGVVVQGDQRGRTIGVPTANVAVPTNMCLPAEGVYAGFAVLADGSRHACAINLGRRPTFYADAEHALLEAHLFDFSGDLYGQRIAVSFRERLRGERAFAGIDELKAQLQSDLVAARNATA
jgi:riboflavin kinase/FMN adenylyltransferase